MGNKRAFVILLWVTRGVTICLTLLLFYWIFNQYFFPSGKLEVVYDFEEDSIYISHLEPWQRLLPPAEENGVWSQRVKDDLVYFNVHNPRWFERITAEIVFNNENQNIIEIGARANSENGYLDRTLQNKIIDELDWKSIDENGVTLFQKEVKYDSIGSFINDYVDNVLVTNEVGQYFYRLPENRIIADYEKSNRETVIDHSIRGSQIIYTYIKDEELDFSFYKTDLNRYIGSDSVAVDIFQHKNGKNIFFGTLDDDGVEEIGDLSESTQELSVQIPNLEEGVYRIEIKGNNDFVINKISSHQKLIVFSKTIFLADNEEYINNFVPGSKSTTLFTNSSIINFKTPHPAGLQNIRIGDSELNLETVNAVYGAQLEGFTEILIPHNDVLIESNGLFAFSKDQYFNPFPLNVSTLNANSSTDSIDYIITRYTPPSEEDGWITKSQTFEVSDLYRDKSGNLRFRLSAPGLGEDEDTIQVKEIRVGFEKPPLTLSNFSERVKNFIAKTIKKIRNEK
ncbi:MAG: hypothetical protein ABIF80_04545 [Patescibacteria group bacterium]